MKTPPIPENESKRQEALAQYRILDTEPEQVFDDLTHIASLICQTPIALISLLDDYRQWFKSKVGIDANETSKEISFCGHAIQHQEILEVSNTLEDERFFDNPLVTSAPHIRFYAGVPLITSEGYPLGTLCVIDRVSKMLTPDQKDALYRLGRHVVQQIERRVTLQQVTALNDSLNQQITFNQTLLNSMVDSVITTDLDGMITSFSRGAEAMLGYQAKELIGLFSPECIHVKEEMIARADELSKMHGTTIAPDMEVFLSKAKIGLSDEREWTYVRKDGSTLPVSLKVTAIQDPNRNTIGYLGVARDITQQKRASSKLANMAEILKHTSEMASIGGWQLDWQTQLIEWSPQMYAIHEFEKHEAPTLEQALSFYPVEARKVVVDAIELSQKDGSTWDFEVPLVTAKGRNIWVRSQGKAMFEHGKPVRFVGAFQDITERKLNEERQHAMEAKQRNALVREVHHRIKNNLHGVSGILRNHAEMHPELESILNQAIGKVHSIAVIHGLQGNNAEHQIELGALLRAIASHHEHLWNTEILLQIEEHWPDCLIQEGEAVPLALVLNELITNAIKHGHQHVPIHIKLGLDTERSFVRMLIINETSATPPSSLEHTEVSGSGLKLIATLVPKYGLDVSWDRCQDKVFTRLVIRTPVIQIITPQNQRLMS